jgi:hypothetical protein
MVRASILLLTVILLAIPVWARGGEAFDPDQPFEQALTHRLLESIVNHAMEAIRDHIEVSGNIAPEQEQAEPRHSLRFKFYPEGKSKSNQHFTAEGWFGPSTDPQQQELHFRFTLPKSKESGPSLGDNDLGDNVL